MVSSNKFYQTMKEEIMLILHSLLQKYNTTKWSLSQECKASSTFENQSIKFAILNMKKNHMVLPIDGVNAFNKIQNLSTVKTLSKLGIQGKFLNFIGHLQKTLANIILNSERSLSSYIRKQGKGVLSHHFYSTLH